METTVNFNFKVSEVNYIPYTNSVLINIREPNKKTDGGILKTDEAIAIEREQLQKGNMPHVILAVGNTVKDYKVGDLVYFSPETKNNNYVIQIEGKTYVEIPDYCIAGKVKNKEVFDKYYDSFMRLKAAKILSKTGVNKVIN